MEILVSLAATIAIQAASPAAPIEIRSPQWLRRPTPAELSGAIPSKALREGVSGRVALSCAVDQTGTITGCRVMSETPSNYRFGEAALKMTDRFQMKPAMQNGQPVAGTVNIPIIFAVPPGGVRAPTSPAQRWQTRP